MGQSELISIIFMSIITFMGLALSYIQKERRLHPEEMGEKDERKYLSGELVTGLGGILSVVNISQYSQVAAIVFAVVVAAIYIGIQLRKK
jgi:hypothetical protein